MLTDESGSGYRFNPNGLVLTPQWVINLAYFVLWDLYYWGWIDEWTYWEYYWVITEAFSGCLVERFSDQGGSFADVRTNVGEPEQPMPGGHFILDSRVLEKLQSQP
jgi:hypothetical protein